MSQKAEDIAFRRKVTKLVTDDLPFRMCVNRMCDAAGLTLAEMLRKNPDPIAALLDSWFDPGLDHEEQFSKDPGAWSSSSSPSPASSSSESPSGKATD